LSSNSPRADQQERKRFYEFPRYSLAEAWASRNIETACASSPRRRENVLRNDFRVVADFRNSGSKFLHRA